MKLSMMETECDCSKCQNACTAPCCGTPQDFINLMKAGYAERLMLDDWPDGNIMLKPALKGHEGCYAPWETRTKEGCTFWKEGKCELHDLKLKPTQGKLYIHSLTEEQLDEIATLIRDSWEEKEAEIVIKFWKKLNKGEKNE